MESLFIELIVSAVAPIRVRELKLPAIRTAGGYIASHPYGCVS